MTHTRSIEFLWTRDRPVAETSIDKTPHTHTQDAEIHAPAGFEPAIPASVRPQTHSLDRTAQHIIKLEIYMVYLLHITTEQ